jgi:hypothetical protein
MLREETYAELKYGLSVSVSGHNPPPLQYHFLNFKSMRKFLAYALALVILLIVLGAVSAYFLKDKIVNSFIEAANEKLATPVKIGKIDISFFSEFPSCAIEFSDVYVEDSHAETFPLFTAKKMSFSFNALDAWNGTYVIQGLNISESETNIRINKKGQGNFKVTKEDGDTGKNISVNLKNILLRRQRVTYVDESVRQSHEFNSTKIAADVALKDNVYYILAKGDAITNQIGIGENIFFKDKLFNMDLSMLYDDTQKLVTFNPSTIEETNGEFELKGNYGFKKQSTLDLVITGKETNIQTILSFLPESMAGAVKQYESEGDLYFGLTVKGNLTEPTIHSDFGCRNATIFHPETDLKITEANLSGSFTSKGVTNFSTAALELRNVNGKLNTKPFTGDLKLNNFNQPVVDLKFKGELDASSVQTLIGREFLKQATGILVTDISMQGQLNKLKSKLTAQQVKITGNLEMKDVFVSTRFSGIDFKDVNGAFQFTNNDLAMSDVKGKLGKSDFILNGFFRNIVSYLLFDDQPLGIETDLQSKFLDLDELLVLSFGEGSTGQYKFEISQNIYLNFDCSLDRLVYKKFDARSLQGDLLVKGQSAYSKKLTMKTMGGEISMSGDISAAITPIELNSTAKFTNIHLDSLFYVFGNFRQDFVQDRHLKGLGTANVSLTTKFNPDLTIIPETLVSHLDIQIKKGELNNFEPIYSLNKYLDDEGLKNLRFADLKNEIHIENQTILIPQMEIRSNVTTFLLNGRHTFDQHIDYRVIAPLRNKKKINIEEAGDAIEKDLAGKLKVYFKITGTTDEYKVAYDTDALKKKLAKDLKQEVAELKDAFKDRDKKKKKEVELADDDYFDWDNN